MSAAKLILGGLGFVLGGPIGAIIGVVIASLLEEDKSLPNGGYGDTTNSSAGARRPTEGDIRISIMVLAAAVMKADGHIKRQELDVVKRYLLRQYSEQGAKEALQMLKGILEKDIDVVAVARQIKANVNYSVRVEIVHFLLDLAHSDDEFVKSEYDLLVLITRELGVTKADFDSMLSLYKRAEDPDWAYKALEIEPTASNEEVKKAYRRMAMKYHPDKVASAGDEVKQKATEKFRGINEAYEQIKKSRGIS